jgi:hypothetical protein
MIKGLKNSDNSVNDNWMMHDIKSLRVLNLEPAEDLQNGYNGVDDYWMMHG